MILNEAIMQFGLEMDNYMDKLKENTCNDKLSSSVDAGNIQAAIFAQSAINYC